MVFQHCKQSVLWFSMLSMVLNSSAWAQFRGQGFFGGNGKAAGQFGQGGGQGQLQPTNRFGGQPLQRPFQQILPAPGNRQPIQNLTPPKRRTFLNNQQSQGAVNPLQQGANRSPRITNRPDRNLGAKGNPLSQARDQRQNKVIDKLPFDGKAVARQAGKPFLPEQLGKIGTGGNPFLPNRRPLTNPKPVRRSTDLKKFGIDVQRPQKQDQQRTGPRRADHVARRLNPFEQNRGLNGLKQAKGIEDKVERVLTGTIRANDPKVIQNFRLGRVDFADKLVADAALRRFRANNATPADRDLIQRLGGIAQLITLSATFMAMPDVCTDFGIIEPMDNGGCQLASLLEPVQILEEGSELADELAESDALEDDEFLADNQVSLIHPYANEVGVDFSIDGSTGRMAPGTQSTYALPRGEKGEIRFATGSGDTTRYTLTAGETYEFYDKDGFWDLRKKKIEDMSAEIPVLNSAQETEPPADSAAPVAQIEDAVPRNDEHEETETTADAAETEVEEPDHLAEIPADAAAVSEASVAVPPVVRKVVGRFAVLNPRENEVELTFRVNGQDRSLAAGKVAILNLMGSSTTVAFSNGDQEQERTVVVGKAYEFWNHDGAWDLREKEVPQQRIASSSGTN